MATTDPQIPRKSRSIGDLADARRALRVARDAYEAADDLGTWRSFVLARREFDRATQRVLERARR